MQNTQLSFNIENAIATQQASANDHTPVMSHLADRLHGKIEAMLQHHSLSSSISLSVKPDDKTMFESVLTDDTANPLYSDMAQTIVLSDAKAVFSYEQAESLFKALHG